MGVGRPRRSTRAARPDMGSLPMENTLLIGLSRQIALQRELDVVANNVANMNTTGYKADGAIFEEYLMPGAQGAGFQGADRRVSYVQDRATWRDVGSGPIRPTGNPLDVAIDGDAFFVVQTPRGERYTRNGAFQINAQGELVTTTGDRVVGDGGPIQFQSTDNSISINPDGTITAREGGDSRNDSARGRLRLVRFDNVQRLQKESVSRRLGEPGSPDVGTPWEWGVRAAAPGPCARTWGACRWRTLS